jgi:acyl-CoA thioester hydrolase
MTFEPSTTTMWVRPNDLDSLGHVNNATVLEYLENGRWDWMARNGIRAGKRVIAVVARIEVDYRRMIATRQVRVETTLERAPHPDEITYQVVFRQQVFLVEESPSLPAVQARVQVGFFDVAAGGLATVEDYFQADE